ncbi:MAG: hypothetical protein RL417_150 [Pseudomonadota bacterium]|jgi:hypothetical protein
MIPSFKRPVGRISGLKTVLIGLTLAICFVGAAEAASPKIREVRLKSLGGKMCILGLEVSVRSTRMLTLKRYRVEVLDKKSKKWRLRRKEPLIRAGGKESRILDRMEQKLLHRYTLVDRAGRKLSRSKIGRLSKLPLCPRVADDLVGADDPVSDGVNDSGASTGAGAGGSAVATPTPTPTATPVPTSTPTPVPTPTAIPPAPVCATLSELLNDWGLPSDCDLDRSGVVDAADLTIFLERW